MNNWAAVISIQRRMIHYGFIASKFDLIWVDSFINPNAMIDVGV